MNKRELFSGLAVSAALLAVATTGTAHAIDGNGSHSVSVVTINNVTTVVVDGVELHGAEAQPYIDAAQERRRR